MVEKLLFEELPEDILLYIWSFLSKNKDSTTLTSVNKYFKQLGDKHGYIKSLSMGDWKDQPMLKCIDIFYKHEKTIQSLAYNKLNDPFVWLCEPLPKSVAFFDCTFSEGLNPPVSKTVCLNIIHDMEYKTKNLLKINWKSFPKLEMVIISTADMDISNLDELWSLPELKRCLIRTFCRKISYENGRLKIHHRLEYQRYVAWDYDTTDTPSESSWYLPTICPESV